MLDAGALVSGRRCRCARWSAAVRRCWTRVVVVASLFVFFALTTLYTLPPSSAATDRRVLLNPDTPPLALLLPPGRGRGRGPASMSSVPPVPLLATPDCDAIVAGDRAEIVSTQRMLFLETRTTTSTAAFGAAFNCTSATSPLSVTSVSGSPAPRHSTSRPPAADVGRSPAGSRPPPPPAPPPPPLAYVIVDGGSDVEQTQLLLRAVYAAANVYCLTVDFCSAASEQVASALRRLTSCFGNVVTVDCGGSRDRNRKWSASEAWWRCVSRLLGHDARWTHVVSLTVGDFPLRSPDDVARRLATAENFDVGRRTGSDVIRCGAYTRSAVSHRPSTPLWRARGGDNSTAGKWSITPSQMHSPGGASALEVCARKCSTDNDGANSPRCYYTVADLPSLVRQRKLFAHAFNLNVDHYAVQCLMQRIVK